MAKMLLQIMIYTANSLYVYENNLHHKCLAIFMGDISNGRAIEI